MKKSWDTITTGFFPTVRAATFSDCERYRYTWRSYRVGAEKEPRLLVIMLNPSVGDTRHADPTQRRVLSFAASAGLGGVDIVNLGAYRTPTPSRLSQVPNAEGEHNRRVLRAAIQKAKSRQDTLVFAWGAGVPDCLKSARAYVYARCKATELAPLCWGLTKEGHPRHPLYVPSDVLLRAFPLHHMSTEPEA